MPDNNIYIHNNTSEQLMVMVTPNPDWAVADITSTIVQVLGSGGLVAFKLAGAPSTISALFSVLNMIRCGISSPLGLAKVLQENSIKVDPGQTQLVSSRGLANPFSYLNPSQWGALCGGSDLAIAVTNQSLTRQAVFNTNSDWSWIVDQNQIVRATYGTTTQENSGAGFYPFSLGDRIAPGMNMAPGNSLAAQNQDAYFVYQADGNAVLYQRNKPAQQTPIWASGTYGKPVSRMALLQDGGLTACGPDNTVVWQSGGTDCQTVIMQDDCNLVIYNSANKPVWATNTYR